MSKYKSPLGNELWISQTYHTNTSNKAVDFGSTPVGTPVYAMANGVIGTISSAYGSYLTLDVDNSDHKLFYVHVYKFKVAKGQRVVVGQQLAEIAPQSVNGGYAPHLHLGLQPQYNLMDYLSRDISIQSKYMAIQVVWFKGGVFDWSKHSDLSYENTNMKKGDRIIVKTAQNIRMSPGGEITGDSIPGQTGVIWDEPRQAMADGKSYTWFDIHFDGAGSGWLADVGKFEIAPVAIPDTPNCDEYIKKVETLQVEIEDLRVEVGGLESELKLADERVTYANKTLKTREAEIDELKANSEAEIKRLQGDLDLKNGTLEETVKELNELKEGRDSILKKIGDIIYKLFKGSSAS